MANPFFTVKKTNPKLTPDVPKKGVGFPFQSKHSRKGPPVKQSLASGSVEKGGNVGGAGATVPSHVMCPNCNTKVPVPGSEADPEVNAHMDQASPSEGL